MTPEQIAMIAECRSRMNYWARIALRGDGGDNALNRAAAWAAILSALTSSHAILEKQHD